MKFLNESGLMVGWCVGKVPPHALSATLLIKGTFDLKPGAAAELAAKQELLSGDAHEEEDPSKPLRYASDFAWFKPRAEATLVGTCHQPGGKANVVCPVSLRIGSWSKRLAVVGDRILKPRLLFFTSISDPLPFQRMKLSYDRSFGGARYPKNPLGRGFGETRLPNIMSYDRLYIDPDSRPEPAGFGPLPEMYPQRVTKVGTLSKTWQKKHWPGLPQDADWSLFNAAPLDQQLPEFFRGDEKVILENLHPKIALYETRLPGLRARWFVTDAKGFREVPMKLDTLWFDMDAERVVLVWRGVTEIRDPKMRDVVDHFVLAEPLSDSPRSLEECAAVRAQTQEAKAKAGQADFPAVDRKLPEVPKPKKLGAEWKKDIDDRVSEMKSKIGEFEKQVDQKKAELEQLQKKNRIPFHPVAAPATLPDLAQAQALVDQTFEKARKYKPDLKTPSLDFPKPTVPKPKPIEGVPKARPISPKWTRESVLAHRGDFRGQDLRGLDLSGADFSGRVFAGATLADANLAGTKFVNADFTSASFRGANLSGADLTEANLTTCDFAEATLEKAKLVGATLFASDLGKAKLAGADLSRAKASKALFTGADLTSAVLREADLTSADLQEALLGKADLRKAILRGAQAGKAQAVEADLDEADLTKFAPNRGADFSRAKIRKVRGDQSVWFESKLEQADFSQSKLARANFMSANLKRANLTHTDLKYARLDEANLEGANVTKVNLFRAVLSSANLKTADLRFSNLFEAELKDAVVEDTLLQGADLSRTKLAGIFETG